MRVFSPCQTLFRLDPGGADQAADLGAFGGKMRRADPGFTLRRLWACAHDAVTTSQRTPPVALANPAP